MKQAIDFGHGPDNTTPGVNDPGAGFAGENERDLVRLMKDDIVSGLKAGGVSVLCITSGAVSQRDNRAASWGADQYLGIHIDSFPGSGTSVWVNRGTARTSKTWKAAYALGNKVAVVLGIGFRGVLEKDFYVLAGRQPDYLLETCNIQSAGDIASYKRNYHKVAAAIVSHQLEWWAQSSGGSGGTVAAYYGIDYIKTGAKVLYIQQSLLRLGYKLPRYGADGDFGTETEAAVKAFQLDHKDVSGVQLEIDGIVGPATLGALTAALDALVPIPAPIPVPASVPVPLPAPDASYKECLVLIVASPALASALVTAAKTGGATTAVTYDGPGPFIPRI